MLKKIVAIGPESTGKSTLCGQLAKHYKTAYVPEFAREYLEKNGTRYTYEDLLIIAKTQITSEEEYIYLKTGNLEPETGNQIQNSPLIIDTDMYVMKVWCEFVFNKCPGWILNQIATRQYDLYLLCNIDLPWVKDNLREYPNLDVRKKLYHYYRELMVNQDTPWIDIKGDYSQRLEKAIDAIDSVIS